jgi:hypothetical protein
MTLDVCAIRLLPISFDDEDVTHELLLRLPTDPDDDDDDADREGLDLRFRFVLILEL